MVWFRPAASLLGTRRTVVTALLSAAAAGLAIWWSFGGFTIPVQALVAVLIAVLLTVFFMWVLSGWLAPDAMLVTGAGPPFDDPALASTGDLAFAKKIRVQAMTNEPLESCRVTMTDPGGSAVTLGWVPDGREEDRLVPGDEEHYVVLPTGRFPVGDHDVLLEVTHARATEAARWSVHLEVQPASFPTVVLQR